MLNGKTLGYALILVGIIFFALPHLPLTMLMVSTCTINGHAMSNPTVRPLPEVTLDTYILELRWEGCPDNFAKACICEVNYDYYKEMGGGIPPIGAYVYRRFEVLYEDPETGQIDYGVSVDLSKVQGYYKDWKFAGKQHFLVWFDYYDSSVSGHRHMAELIVHTPVVPVTSESEPSEAYVEFRVSVEGTGTINISPSPSAFEHDTTWKNQYCYYPSQTVVTVTVVSGVISEWWLDGELYASNENNVTVNVDGVHWVIAKFEDATQPNVDNPVPEDEFVAELETGDFGFPLWIPLVLVVAGGVLVWHGWRQKQE